LRSFLASEEEAFIEIYASTRERAGSKLLYA
jgi:hypothetical protein